MSDPRRLLLDAVPDGCGTALVVGDDVGALAGRAERVVAVDVDDVLDADLPPGSFDAVLAVDVLHHLDLEAGLRRLSELVAPGGVLGIVAPARSRSGWDLAHDLAGLVATRGHPDRTTVAPRVSYTQVLRTAALLLPGCRYRRHIRFRWSLVWRRPPSP